MLPNEGVGNCDKADEANAEKPEHIATDKAIKPMRVSRPGDPLRQRIGSLDDKQELDDLDDRIPAEAVLPSAT